MTIPDPAASIVITTRNRREELRRALRSAVAQEGPPFEVLVIDDGSTDGTAQMVHTEFPSVIVEQREKSLGYIIRRNEAARLARAPIVFSIDDDAEFPDSRTVAQTLAEFNDSRVGAVAIPYIDVLRSAVVHQRAPAGDEPFVTDSFIGTAHALQRELFLALGGYRETLVHQGEERDYCLRMLSAGYVVRLGRAAPIHHHESPRRDWRRMDYFGRRNDMLFAWHNVPLPAFPFHLAATTANGLRAALRAHHPMRMLAGLAQGSLIGASDRFRARSRPVAADVYRLHRRLKIAGPLLLEQIALSSSLKAAAPEQDSLKRNSLR